ncbi:glycosyltransferase [Thermaurantiacus tibetensis]|uniref:glycosyltransferase n=1 Tax=Thermaurantiacus tibetensis TaxID=2759035 RepID=UPI00188F4F03|nr:glycosyltransferase [Thermaurantiacus tibetensis]
MRLDPTQPAAPEPSPEPAPAAGPGQDAVLRDAAAARGTLVLLSLGHRMDETAGPPPPGEPQPHWREVARMVGADIASFSTASARRGPLFARLFASRPVWGSAASAALDAARYGRVYALDEDVGLRAALLLAARGWKGRFVLLVHHLSPRRRRLVRLLAGRPITHFLTYAAAQRSALVAAGVPPGWTSCVPIPADAGFFRPAARAPGRARLVAVGAADRDYSTLLAAAPMIDAEIEIFGHGYSGPDAARLAGQALPANVRLMPHLPVAAFRDRIASADAAVLPLRPVAYAAGATALVEAMACGLPVVATAIAGLAGYLSAGRPGPVFAPGDAGGLAAAATRLIAERALARSIGAGNRAWVERHATVERLSCHVANLLLGTAGGVDWLGETAP